MGSYTQRRNKSLLIDLGENGNQPRERRDPVYSVFQITEDIRLKRLRSMRTPNVIQHITERTLFSKNTRREKHSPRAPFPPHVANHPLGLLSISSLRYSCRNLLARGHGPSLYLSPQPLPISFSPSHLMDSEESPASSPCYLFSLLIKNPPRTFRFVSRSQLEVKSSYRLPS